MSERIIVTRANGVPRLLRLEVVADLWAEHSGDSWCLVAGLTTGPARVLAANLEEAEALELWRTCRDWLSHRGGLVLDVEAWRSERAELAAAGTAGGGASVPRRKRAGRR